MNKKKEYTVAVLGTQNPVGKAILEELDRQDYPIGQIHPLDLHQEAGAPIVYHNQTLHSSALDLFDLTQPHVLFLCEPRIFDRYPHHFLHGKNWLIDCTGKIQSATCIVPDLNGGVLHHLHHKCLCAPNSATIALAHALHPLHCKYTLSNVQVVATLGAWYPLPNLVDSLIQQTRHCFTQTPITQSNIYPSLAFNLIPDFFKDLAPLIEHQMKCFIPTPTQVNTCFAPVLRGGAFFVRAKAIKTPHSNGVKSLYMSSGPCQLLDSKMPIGTHDLLAEDKIFIQNIEIHKHSICFWLMQDPLQTGFIQNAVQILNVLSK